MNLNCKWVWKNRKMPFVVSSSSSAERCHHHLSDGWAGIAVKTILHVECSYIIFCSSCSFGKLMPADCCAIAFLAPEKLPHSPTRLWFILSFAKFARSWWGLIKSWWQNFVTAKCCWPLVVNTLCDLLSSSASSCLKFRCEDGIWCGVWWWLGDIWI